MMIMVLTTLKKIKISHLKKKTEKYIHEIASSTQTMNKNNTLIKIEILDLLFIHNNLHCKESMY